MTDPDAPEPVPVQPKALRAMRSLVGGVLVGFLAVGGLVAMRLIEDQRRCEAGNQFRSEDLPAAFRLHDQHLGRAFRADDAQIESFSNDFETDLAELLPLRDCSLF